MKQNKKATSGAMWGHEAWPSHNIYDHAKGQTPKNIEAST